MNQTAAPTSPQDRFYSVDWDDLKDPPRWRRPLWLVAGILVIVTGFVLGTAVRYALPDPPPLQQQEAPPQ